MAGNFFPLILLNPHMCLLRLCSHLGESQRNRNRVAFLNSVHTSIIAVNPGLNMHPFCVSNFSVHTWIFKIALQILWNQPKSQFCDSVSYNDCYHYMFQNRLLKPGDYLRSFMISTTFLIIRWSGYIIMGIIYSFRCATSRIQNFDTTYCATYCIKDTIENKP